jgi:hypothetical protein
MGLYLEVAAVITWPTLIHIEGGDPNSESLTKLVIW